MIIPGVVASGRYEAAVGVTALDLGANAFNFTGATVKRVVPAGVKSMRLKLWGGGGGGGQFGKEGGPGGFVFTTVEVSPGDLLLIQVGGGGGDATTVPPRLGGAGGWPDGGDAGFSNSNLYALGGGGGSSRVFVNGALKAVAAGGGGGGGNSGGSSLNGGGGFHGESRILNSQNPTGGHTTDGGFDPPTVIINPFSVGTFLKGGRGYAGATRFDTNTAAGAGGGGGGGYYGGGGGGGGIGGSGGSSFYSLAQALERLNTTTMGVSNPPSGQRSAAPATGDPAYPGNNVATGGSATFANQAVNTPGGDGFIQVFTYANSPQPVRVSQQDVQIVSQPLGAVRVTQQAVEVAFKLGIEPVRVTQQTIEVPYISAPAPVRVTQQTVEVIYSL